MEMGLRSNLNVDIFVVGVSLWMNQKHTIRQPLSFLVMKFSVDSG
jgi:hypothetical protein